jgi:uncharacterized repeat protein (TIGR02543 family)
MKRQKNAIVGIFAAVAVFGLMLAACDNPVDSGSTKIPVTGVSLNKTTLTLIVGGVAGSNTETLIHTIAPSNATNNNVTWSTSNSTIATVSNGTITAVGVGITTITVTTTDGGFKDECEVTVNDANDPATAALQSKITEAKNLKSQTEINTDAENVAKGAYWVIQEVMTAFENAINVAEDAIESVTTQAELDSAVSALAAAIETFKGERTKGEKTSGFTPEQVTELINNAKTDKDTVKTSVNGDDVSPADQWVSQSDLDALNNAITALENASGQSAIDAAYNALVEARDTFNKAKKPGTATSGSTSFTVSFDSDGGSAVQTQSVTKDGNATEPGNPVKYPGAGLYQGAPDAISYAFDGWYNGDAKWNFSTDKVTQNITLKAKWTSGATRIETVAVNSVTAAVTHVKATPATYTLLIDQNINADAQTLDVAGVNLTIIGMGNERTITYNGATNASLFAVSQGMTSLTLGDNITLNGRSGSTTNLVRVTAGSLTMKDGSKITGHTTNSGTGAVFVTGTNSFFTMEGGEISGNISTDTINYFTTGGVYISTSGKFVMSGGKITGNYGNYTTTNNTSADLWLTATVSFTLSGAANIDTLQLPMDTTDANIHASVILGGSYTGTVDALNLCSSTAITTVTRGWENKMVIKAATGYIPTATDIGKFKLGKFVCSTSANNRPITGNNLTTNPTWANYRIETTPEDIGKLVRFEGNQTPVATDYTFGNLNQTEGNVTAVSVMPKEGMSSGARTVYYAGFFSTIKSTTIPQELGYYTVTFDVAAAEGWNAATNLFAGTLYVEEEGNTNQAPVAGDYTIGNLEQTEGNVTAVTITANSGKSPGAVSNIRYDGSTDIPQAQGTYAVTFDVAAAEGWNARINLSAGNLIVNLPGSINQTPVAEDYTIGNLEQTVGNITAVSITPKEGKSPGVVSNICYDGSTDIPQTQGTYAVTFDVAAAEGWSAKTSLSAGNLIINPAGNTNQTPVAEDYTIGNLEQTAGSVTAVSITPNIGKSSGARTVYYEGVSPTSYTKSVTPPTSAGTYAVTFNVAAATGWNAATNLSAGNLVVASAGPRDVVIVVNLAGVNEDTLIEQAAQATANTDKVFTVTGTYSTYKWYLDGTQVGTASTYTFNKPNGVYQLIVVVTNSSGESRSGRCWITIQPYTVTFSTNDGSGTVSAQSVNPGFDIFLHGGLSRTGYTFGGWNTDPAGTGTNYDADSFYTPTGDITFYARWYTNYTVTFNVNNGSGTVSARTGSAISSITLPDGSGLSRDGYTFGGWNTSSNGMGTNYNAGSSYTPTGDITLYARWYAIYTVNFNVNSGNGTTPAARTGSAISSITLPDGSGLSRYNYDFGGWNTLANGTGTNYDAGSSYTPTSNITLYARWHAIYTVEFNVNGIGGATRRERVGIRV